MNLVQKMMIKFIKEYKEIKVAYEKSNIRH